MNSTLDATPPAAQTANAAAAARARATRQAQAASSRGAPKQSVVYTTPWQRYLHRVRKLVRSA